MAITSSQTQAKTHVNLSQGRHLDDAATPAAVTVQLGFVARYIRFVNLTDRIEWEWFEGNASGTTLKTVAAGTRTLDTADAAIVPIAGVGNQDGKGAGTATQTVGTAPTGGFTVPAALILQNKQYQWYAHD